MSDPSLSELIAQVEQQIAIAQIAHDQAQEALVTTTQRIATETDRLRVLRSFQQAGTGTITENGDIATVVDLVDAAVIEWQRLDRTEAILRVLRERDTSMSNKEIMQVLQSRGRVDDDYGAISAALAYLFRQSRIQRVGRGRYEVQKNLIEQLVPFVQLMTAKPADEAVDPAVPAGRAEEPW